jgi:hypothetical protein
MIARPRRRHRFCSRRRRASDGRLCHLRRSLAPSTRSLRQDGIGRSNRRWSPEATINAIDQSSSREIAERRSLGTAFPERVAGSARRYRLFAGIRSPYTAITASTNTARDTPRIISAPSIRDEKTTHLILRVSVFLKNVSAPPSRCSHERRRSRALRWPLLAKARALCVPGGLCANSLPAALTALQP